MTSHGEGSRNPLRVVMSRELNLPMVANLWDVSVAPTLVLCQTGVNEAVAAALTQQGVEVVRVKALTPKVAMAILYERKLMQVLWECGGTLAAEAIAADAVQKLWAFVAPKIIGGQGAPSPIGDLGLQKMTEAKQLTRTTLRAIGDDLLLQGYFVAEGDLT